MEYKKFDCGSYNLHVIKTNKFKTVHMEILFRSEALESEMPKRTMLSDILTDCSKNYPNKKDIVVKLEELYKTIIYGTTNKTGNVLNTIFVTDFIAPEFIKEKSYYEEVLSFFIELIMNPNVENKEFDIKTFNVIKERMKVEIESIDENPIKKSIRGALKAVAPDKATSYSVLGTLENLESITPSNLYQSYENMIKKDLCDIFIIGDVDPEETEKIIKKYFKLRTIKTRKLDLYINNDFRKKVLEVSDTGEFVQTSLEMIYNVGVLDTYEKNIVFQVMNYILGNGGITSKLYYKVREENSLCYGISSMYLKYDRLLMVQVSLDDKNRKLATKLIKKCIVEMAKGKFSEDDLNDAKQNLINSIEMSQDNNISILNNYVFRILDDLHDYEERIKLIKGVTKEEVVNVAKKLKLNTIYYLSGGQNE